jgi:hypothetical protein
MRYKPPRGVRPPQLEGRRSGRPKGIRNHAAVRADIDWAFEHRYDPQAIPPTPAARYWWRLAQSFPDEFEYWVEHDCQVTDHEAYCDGY